MRTHWGKKRVGVARNCKVCCPGYIEAMRKGQSYRNNIIMGKRDQRETDSIE
jgi:hypothetical protein